MSRYQKAKTNLDFTEARDSGISWAICKSAPCSRQITTPATHHSVFYRPDALLAAQPTVSKHWRDNLTYLTIHTHTHLTALCPGLPGWAGTRKVIWILLEQETVSGSGISWTICKSAPSSRQMPAPHHSVFYRPDALPAAQPTLSKHWRLLPNNTGEQFNAQHIVNLLNHHFQSIHPQQQLHLYKKMNSNHWSRVHLNSLTFYTHLVLQFIPLNLIYSR